MVNPELIKNRYLPRLQALKKKNLAITLLILLALPATILLAQEKQIFQKDASSGDNVLAQQAAAPKPNVVIIMLDDVNPMDGRFFTQQRTPHIWKNIISKGINFTNFYVETTLCCPGRAGYLTGQHTQNHGVPDLDGRKFQAGTTIATELSSVGYHTMHVGKYLNNYTNFTRDIIPPGWNVWNAIWADNGKYYNYNIIHKNGTKTYYGNTAADYSTDVIANIMVDRMKSAPSTKPIFGTLNPYAIHNPDDVAPRHKGDARCANIQPWNPPNFNEDDVSDKPQWVRGLAKYPYATGYRLKVDCEKILSVDDMVGKVAAELSRQGRLSNTVFILAADNGYGFFEHRMPGKTVPYATHTPFYVSWPQGRGVNPAVNHTFLSNIDLAPTLCELAGCTMGPYPNGQQKADGLSFATLLRNQPYAWARDAILESQPVNMQGGRPLNAEPHSRPPWWALRTTQYNSLGLWHYVEYSTGERELYDMSNGPCYSWTPSKGGDPCELNNLLRADRTPSASTQAIASALKTRLQQLKAEKGASYPTITPTLTPTPTSSPSPTLSPTPVSSPSPTGSPSSALEFFEIEE